MHWRDLIEEAAEAGRMHPVVVADLDMQNFFNSVEWPAIRAALEHVFPEALPAVRWEQATQGVTILADASETKFNRGSEQGEALGAVKAVGPLADARAKAHSTPENQGIGGVQDEWYVDDGVVVCHPARFHHWL